MPLNILIKLLYHRWYKDTMLLDPSDNKLMESMGNRFAAGPILIPFRLKYIQMCRHTLILQNLAITDFGNYSCMADNSLGRDRGFIQLSGKELMD